MSESDDSEISASNVSITIDDIVANPRAIVGRDVFKYFAGHGVCHGVIVDTGFSTTAMRHRGAPAPKRTDARESLFSKAVVYTFVIHYTRARRPKLRAHSPLVGERRRGINLEL